VLGGQDRRQRLGLLRAGGVERPVAVVARPVVLVAGAGVAHDPAPAGVGRIGGGGQRVDHGPVGPTPDAAGTNVVVGPG
jgi:hypothetical protein